MLTILFSLDFSFTGYSPQSTPTLSSASVNRILDSNLVNYNKLLESRNKKLVDQLDQHKAEIAMLRTQTSTGTQSGQQQQLNGGINSSGSWTQSDLCRAFAMKKLCAPLFEYTRNTYGISTPEHSVIDDFIQSIHLSRGVQTTMIDILKHEAEMMQDHERTAILQTSIIRTSEMYEYNEQSDTIWGPHKFVVAIVANGLYRDWHQLVYLNFDVRVNKNTLNTVIEALHRVGIQVVGCTCNFEDGQPNIWAELDVSYGRNYFAHPINNAPIYAFYFLDDLLAAANKHFNSGSLAIDGLQLSRDSVIKIIQDIFRRVPIDREFLKWTDNVSTNARATRKFFSQYTIDLLRLREPDDRTVKATAEFINIIKSFADIMNKEQIVDNDTSNVNFDTYRDYQSKKMDKVHSRLFKIQCNVPDQVNKQFREAIMMTIVSLKLLQTSMLHKYKYSSFCTRIITNEYLKTRFNSICNTNSFDETLPPVQTFRIFKDIFLGENCSIKLEPKHKFFSNKIDLKGRSESDCVQLLFDWLIGSRQANKVDSSDLRNKLVSMEEMFRGRQNPNFRIRDGVIGRLTKKFTMHGFRVPNDLIQQFVLQRHLLRVKFLNENDSCSIPHDIQGENSSIVDTITLDE